MIEEGKVNSQIRVTPMNEADWIVHGWADPIGEGLCSYGTLEPVHHILDRSLGGIRWRLDDDES